MRICAVCSTYKRPSLLNEAVESFLRQTHPDKEMVILDDAGQYAPEAADHLPGVKLITTKHRFRTLGEKRNASVALASPEASVFCVWDDDDIYLPWHMEAAAKTIETRSGVNDGYTIPSIIYIDKRNHLERKMTGHLFHPAWAFTRNAFTTVDGYPAMQSGQDQGLRRRWVQRQIARFDPIKHDSRPSFVYRWGTTGNKHLSAMGEGGYERLAGMNPVAARIDKILPHWSKDWASLALDELSGIRS